MIKAIPVYLSFKKNNGIDTYEITQHKYNIINSHTSLVFIHSLELFETSRIVAILYVFCCLCQYFIKYKEK